MISPPGTGYAETVCVGLRRKSFTAASPARNIITRLFRRTLKSDGPRDTKFPSGLYAVRNVRYNAGRRYTGDTLQFERKRASHRTSRGTERRRRNMNVKRNEIKRGKKTTN